MSKRFTDTEKWEDPWFRNLLSDYQRFWIYILDRCDNAGVWKVDFEAAEFYLKQDCKQEELLQVFKDRVVPFDNDSRWFIPKFISFQYGELTPTCHPHQPVLKLLKIYKLEGYLKGINTFKTRQDNIRQDKKDLQPVDNSKKRVHFENCVCARCKK